MKLVALGLDGTLLRNDGTSSERTQESLHRMSERGAKIVLTTQRPIRLVQPIAARYGISGTAMCSQGLVLASLASEHGIRAEDAIGFGNMPNDVPLLRRAGRSVAMGNAHPDVLRSAAEVTSSNEGDGVAVVFERLFR